MLGLCALGWPAGQYKQTGGWNLFAPACGPEAGNLAALEAGAMAGGGGRISQTPATLHRSGGRGGGGAKARGWSRKSECTLAKRKSDSNRCPRQSPAWLFRLSKVRRCVKCTNRWLGKPLEVGAVLIDTCLAVVAACLQDAPGADVDGNEVLAILERRAFATRGQEDTSEFLDLTGAVGDEATDKDDARHAEDETKKS